MGILDIFKKEYAHKNKELTIKEYLVLCKKDSSAYDSPAERLLKTIGRPEFIDTKDDPKLARVFSNRIIKR